MLYFYYPSGRIELQRRIGGRWHQETKLDIGDISNSLEKAPRNRRVATFGSLLGAGVFQNTRIFGNARPKHQILATDRL